MSDYSRFIAYVSSQFWALERSTFEQMMAVLVHRASGERFTDEEIQARVAEAGGRSEGPLVRHFQIGDGQVVSMSESLAAAGGDVPQRGQTVAVIGVYGILAHRAGSMLAMSGGTSTERLTQAVRQAANDASVKGIVLDISSPGGAVEGVSELAAEIRAARALKPVEAVANASAGSGAYWLGSAASYMTAIPSGRVGSIGAYTTHIDDTKAQEMTGEVRHVISDEGAPYKAEGESGVLPDDGRAYVQTMVTKYGDMFRADVAKNRGVGVDTVRKTFGGGRMLMAKDALVAGMIDGIGSLEDAIRRVARGATPERAQARAEDGAPEVVALDMPLVTDTAVAAEVAAALCLTPEQQAALAHLKSTL